MKKNVLVVCIVCVAYFFISIATSPQIQSTEYENCVYNMEGKLLTPIYGRAQFIEHYKIDTIFYRITDTSKINVAANYICQTLKDSCGKQNTVLQFYDTAFSVRDPIRQVSGRLVKTVKCN